MMHAPPPPQIGLSDQCLPTPFVPVPVSSNQTTPQPMPQPMSLPVSIPIHPPTPVLPASAHAAAVAGQFRNSWHMSLFKLVSSFLHKEVTQ